MARVSRPGVKCRSYRAGALRDIKLGSALRAKGYVPELDSSLSCAGRGRARSIWLKPQCGIVRIRERYSDGTHESEAGRDGQG